jgi:L,D-transpeptidase YcbB
VKTYSLRYIPAIIFLCTLRFVSVAQIDSFRIQQFLSETRYANNSGLVEFYRLVNYKTAWIQQHNTNDLAVLLSALNRSAEMGLREKDYGLNFIQSFYNKNIWLQNIEDSLNAEVKITVAALQFYNDIAFGNTKPSIGYNGLKYAPACRDIPALLAESISKTTLRSLDRELDGTIPEIAVLENKLRWILRITNDSNYTEVIITSKKINNTNTVLITRLYQLGIIDVTQLNLPDSILKNKVKEAQIQFNLLADGVIRSTLLQELNTHLSVRLEQLNLSINYYRWLNCMAQIQPVIVVNIPAAYMKVYDRSKVLLEMRMVVGKSSTPTPTLISTVDEVVLYPYWHVPYSIATKEILPILKRNPGYINTGNYQVLNQAGRIIDPGTVNWNALSRSYFPYILRQSTGCDNALGLLKLNFYSPFGVYLHDTNGKSFFKYNRRYFSHGCMRMEKPMELGHLLLKKNRVAIDTLEQKGCLLNKSPILVHADVHMPVIVWYTPAGIDSAGRVLFYEDIYGKFKQIKR